MRTLSVERILDLAERSYLLDGDEEFVHVIRENKSISHFYEELERELKQWPQFKIIQYKKVKEGHVHVARAYKILLTSADMLLLRPHLKQIRESFYDALKFSDPIPVDDFIRKNFTLCYKKHFFLKDCLEVYNFLMANHGKWSGLLPRQIPHNQSTKIIGKESLLLSLFSFAHLKEECSWEDFFEYFGLLARSPEFRLYAPVCSWKGVLLSNFHGIVSEDIVVNYDFKNLKNTLIVENLESFLPLINTCVDTLLIWGSGWKCVQLSRFISKLPGIKFYWGDIDKEGIEIASQFRQEAGVIPVSMDRVQMERFKHLSQNVVYSTPVRELIFLQDVYHDVCHQQIRIEQEKIPFDWSLIKNFVE